jgi:hypothetical protein
MERLTQGRCSRDDGSVVLEFVVIAMGVLVPLLYIALAVMHTTGAAMATSQAARSAARAFSVASSPAQGLVLARAAARLAFADHGLTLPADALHLSCSRECLAPGSRVSVDIDWRAPLPVVGRAVAIPLHSRQDLQIDDMRGDVA